MGGGGDLYCPSKQDRPGQGEEVGGGGDLYCPSRQDRPGQGEEVGGGGDLYCPSKQDRPGQGEEVGGGGDLYCPSKQDRWEVVVIFTVQANKTGLGRVRKWDVVVVISTVQSHPHTRQVWQGWGRGGGGAILIV